MTVASGIARLRLQTFTFGPAAGLGSALVLLVSDWLLINSAASATIGKALAIAARTPRYFSRSTGTFAYVVLAGSTIWGLLLSTKLIKAKVPVLITSFDPLITSNFRLLTDLLSLRINYDQVYMSLFQELL